MFEYHEDDGRYYAMHHPFTSPVDDDLPLLERAVQNGEQRLLGQVRAKAYDAVVNGIEVAAPFFEGREVLKPGVRHPSLK